MKIKVTDWEIYLKQYFYQENIINSQNSIVRKKKTHENHGQISEDIFQNIYTNGK